MAGGAARIFPANLGKAYLTLIEQQVADEVAMRVVGRCEVRAAGGVNSPMRGVVRDRLVAKLAAAWCPRTRRSGGRPPQHRQWVPQHLSGGAHRRGQDDDHCEACRCSLSCGKSLERWGSITIDTYRIAAVDQLRTICQYYWRSIKSGVDARGAGCRGCRRCGTATPC